MGYKSTIQIILVIVSVVIIVTYINPTFNQMKATQNETREYQNALDSAASFNAELQRLQTAANSFNATERQALSRYLPDTIDTIAVMRDIETIATRNSMILTGVSSEASENTNSSQVNAVQNPRSIEQDSLRDYEIHSEQFLVRLAGTYENFKLLLQDFERNAYPLEITSITFSPEENALYTFALTLETYGLNGVTE